MDNQTLITRLQEISGDNVIIGDLNKPIDIITSVIAFGDSEKIEKVKSLYREFNETLPEDFAVIDTSGYVEEVKKMMNEGMSYDEIREKHGPEKAQIFLDLNPDRKED